MGSASALRPVINTLILAGMGFGASAEAVAATTVCYGTYGLDKHSCDNALKTDMINSCILVVGPSPPGYAEADFMQKCKDQAELYSSGLQSWRAEVFVSGPAFTSAQDDGFCRYMSDDFASNDCNWVP